MGEKKQWCTQTETKIKTIFLSSFWTLQHIPLLYDFLHKIETSLLAVCCSLICFIYVAYSSCTVYTFTAFRKHFWWLEQSIQSITRKQKKPIYFGSTAVLTHLFVTNKNTLFCANNRRRQMGSDWSLNPSPIHDFDKQLPFSTYFHVIPQLAL